MRYIILFIFIHTVCFSQENKISNSCNAGFYSTTFDANNISTKIFSGGDMHWDMFGSGIAKYEFPKGSGKTICNAAHLWVGGLDWNNNLKIAGQTYRQTGVDFWPGPLSTMDASTNSDNCLKYDYIWKVNTSDVNDFVHNYNNGNVQNGSYIIPHNILTWPVADTTISHVVTNAPFVDVNHNGKYDPKNEGDYPLLKGDQTLFQIYNDNGNVHQATGGMAIGVQINKTMYGYNCESVVQQYPELLNSTFYHYKIYNKSQYNLHNTYVTFWVDTDIGTRTDDYVGSNPRLGYGFAYNGYNVDAVYGNKTPSLGVLLLKSAKAFPFDGIDNDNDSIMDEPGEELLIPRIFYYNHELPSTYPAMLDPDNAQQYYQYMSGYWKDGNPFTCFGKAYGGAIPAHSVFTGSNTINSDCGNNWTEKSVVNPVGNRCLMISVGPLNFEAQDSLEFEYAMIASIDSSISNSSVASTIQLQKDVKKIKQFYNEYNKSDCFMEVGISELDLAKNISITPNPVVDVLNIKSELFKNKWSYLKINDVLGREVYQNTLNKTIQTIDMSHLQKGLYFITVSVNDQILTKKIIKE